MFKINDSYIKIAYGSSSEDQVDDMILESVANRIFEKYIPEYNTILLYLYMVAIKELMLLIMEKQERFIMKIIRNTSF